MRETVRAAKRQLRQRCRQVREALGEDDRLRASRAICAHIEAWPAFVQAGTVLAYLPMRAEVDLRPLLERHPAKCWGLPRILPQGEMFFHVYEPGRLVRHPYGMLEPEPDLPLIPPDEAQLALVPGVAYDRRGWRLGYGGGYFDRFLAAFSGTALGVTYQVLLLDRLPHSRRDVPVKFIVTEEGILRTAP